MQYINPTPAPSGALYAPQSAPAPGLVPFPDEFMGTYNRVAGFVHITITRGVVSAVEADEDAFRAWKDGLPDPLPEAKAARIAESKTALAAYLLEHPLQWTDGEYYSITAEKQQQLTSKIMSATMAQTLSQPYRLTWNSTGNVCREWELSDLMALAFSIDARVTALVTYQQTQEVAMQQAATLEDLEAVVVDYDAVV